MRLSRTRRLTLCSTASAAISAVLAGCGFGSGASAAPSGTPGAGGVPGKKIATIELEKGPAFSIELFPKEAPKWVENFVQKANAGFYNGLLFHRVEDWVVQGGDPRGNGTGGNNSVPTEKSERPFTLGSVGVARRGDSPQMSNDSQFFVVTKPPPPQLNGKWVQLDGQYTLFGQVIEGMNVVTSIAIGDKIKRIVIKG
jgi:peptidyl-prolyl cis-trans isomerase B (cyclophilin B)